MAGASQLGNLQQSASGVRGETRFQERVCHAATVHMGHIAGCHLEVDTGLGLGLGLGKNGLLYYQTVGAYHQLKIND